VASVHGAVGSGWVWASSNAAFFVLWVPFVHRRFAPGLHRHWLLADVLRIAAAPGALGLALATTLPWSTGRAGSLVLAGLSCALMGIVAFALNDLARAHMSAVL